MKSFRNVAALGIRTKNQATHARAVAELRAVRPGFHVRRIDMVEPAAPVVPSDEDHAVGPKPTFDNGVDLVHRPLHAMHDVPNQGIACVVGIRRMFARVMRRIHPRDVWKLSRAGIDAELFGLKLLARV